jgi:hypothetical protein
MYRENQNDSPFEGVPIAIGKGDVLNAKESASDKTELKGGRRKAEGRRRKAKFDSLK